jgi:aryl-alcohol dehydrogenase-like predicted oxidoreductase
MATKMEYRQLGGSGFKVPALCLGTGTFGGSNEFFKAWGAVGVEDATASWTFAWKPA